MNYAQKTILAVIALICITMPFASALTIQGIQDIVVSKNSNEIAKAVDLRNYANDSEQSADELFYSLENQSNTALIQCYLQDKYYISCAAPEEDATGYSEISVSVSNATGKTEFSSFNINVKETYSTAIEEIKFSLDRSSVKVENGDSINVQAAIENSTQNNECFTLKTKLNFEERDEIEVTPAATEFCLNSGEKTNFTITITSFTNARTDYYIAEAELKYSNKKITKEIAIDVIDNENTIDVTRISDYYVCKEPYTQEIKVRLENNSGRRQAIQLSAEHDVLMPAFEFSETELGSGQEDEISLSINTNETTKLGDYKIPVYIRSEKYYVERDIEFRLVECSENVFDLSVTPETRTIERGEEKNFTVKLFSRIDEDQTVYLSSDSDLPNTLQSTEIFLPANSEKTISLRVKARETDKNGKHNVKVYAWNSKETEEKTVKAEIVSEHKFEIIVKNNDFDARICSANSTQVFEIIARNNGDYDEEVRFSINNSNDSIQAVLSDSTLKVKKGKEASVYVFVNPSYDAPSGKYSIYLNATASGIRESKELRFTVVEPEAGMQENAIEATSYPKQVTIKPGEEKFITFTIQNTTNNDIKDVKIRFYGAENSEISILPISIGTLEAKQKTEIKRKISANENAEEKIYNATMEIKGEGTITLKNIKIIVSTKNIKNNEENTEKKGAIAGFLTFLGGHGAFLGVIILILLIGTILVLSLLNSNKSTENVYGRGT